MLLHYFNRLIIRVTSVNHDIIILYFYKRKYLSWLVWCASFSYDSTKHLFIPWKFRSTKRSKYWFCGTNIFDWYSFQLIMHLSLYFHCFNTFLLPWVDKVATGRYTKFCISYFKGCFLIWGSIRWYNTCCRPG